MQRPHRLRFSLALSRNGNFFASASQDHTVRLWDSTTLQQIGPALQHGSAQWTDDPNVRIWSLKGIIPPSLLNNTTTALNDAVDEPNHDSQHLSNLHPPAEKDPQSTKDDKKGKNVEKKDGPKGETALKRRPSESSSLRDFLDCPAVVPLAANTCDPLYNNFFIGDSPPPPLPQQHEPPQNSVPKFGSIFTHKTKDRKDRTRSRPDRKRAVHGAQAECSVDVRGRLLAATSCRTNAS
ncbi:hypothetical protein BU15DRAFT_83664 [Melanogaster broomeanus]|nr:hypothetical protein BU15DRAFT_83664 [Melanogaster broomeanus]